MEKLTKFEEIKESVERNYPYFSETERKRMVKQLFATWLLRGRTAGSKIDPESGKRKLIIHGENIALLI